MSNKAIARNIERSLKALNNSDFEEALLYACHSVDATAKAKYKKNKKPKLGVGSRIKKFIDEYSDFYVYFTLNGMLTTKKDALDWRIDGKPNTTSEVFYHIIRCPIDHGEDIHDYVVYKNQPTLGLENNKFIVSPGFIISILLSVISDPVNIKQILHKPLDIIFAGSVGPVSIPVQKYWGDYEGLKNLIGFKEVVIG